MIGNRDKKVLSAFGKNLKKARLAKKLSIRGLADLADIDFSNLHLIEKGESNPTLTTIMVLAEALEIDPCRLLP
jgi:transcriptional regulator with XRE-family HTH domain